MPKLSCGVAFMRGLLLLLNILFVILGLALLGIGIYAKVSNNFASILEQISKETDFEGQSFGYLSFVMIGGGVFTLIIALLGCMGTLWNNRCLLYFYGIVLLILMILELTAFIMAFAYKGKLKEIYDTSLTKAFDTGLKENKTKFIEAFQELEVTMKCCGVHNLSDYNQYNYTQRSTWCKEHPTSDGCSKAIIDFLNKNLPAIGITLGVVIALELFGLISAFMLAVALKHAPEEYSSNPIETIRAVVPGNDRRRRYN